MNLTQAKEKAEKMANKNNCLYFIYWNLKNYSEFKVSKIVEAKQPLKWELHEIIEPAN